MNGYYWHFENVHSEKWSREALTMAWSRAWFYDIRKLALNNCRYFKGETLYLKLSLKGECSDLGFPWE